MRWMGEGGGDQEAWRRVRGGWTEGWLAVSEWQVHFIKTPSAALWSSRVIRRPAQPGRTYPYPRRLFPTRVSSHVRVHVYTGKVRKWWHGPRAANAATRRGNIYERQVWTDMSLPLISPRSTLAERRRPRPRGVQDEDEHHDHLLPFHHPFFFLFLFSFSFPAAFSRETPHFNSSVFSVSLRVCRGRGHWRCYAIERVILLSFLSFGIDLPNYYTRFRGWHKDFVQNSSV